jgi:hypothetical protein
MKNVLANHQLTCLLLASLTFLALGEEQKIPRRIFMGYSFVFCADEIIVELAALQRWHLLR